MAYLPNADVRPFSGNACMKLRPKSYWTAAVGVILKREILSHCRCYTMKICRECVQMADLAGRLKTLLCLLDDQPEQAAECWRSRRAWNQARPRKQAYLRHRRVLRSTTGRRHPIQGRPEFFSPLDGNLFIRRFARGMRPTFICGQLPGQDFLDAITRCGGYTAPVAMSTTPPSRHRVNGLRGLITCC